MAPSLAGLNTFASRYTRSTNPSSSLRMPRVFVIPPEEEQQDNPPWCCFDVDTQPENDNVNPLNPDVIDVASSIARSFLLGSRVPISKKLEKKQRPEAIKIIENKPSHARHGDPREDSDVIEVVKVKRSRDALMDLEENTNTKRSKTLRTRATRALQSIKNVGKSSRRTHVKDIWTSTGSIPSIFKGTQGQLCSQQNENQIDFCSPSIPANRGSLSRNSSRSLLQIFQPTKPSSEFPFTLRVPPSVGPAEAFHSLPDVSTLPSPHLRYDTHPSLNANPNALTIDGASNRPASLNSSAKKSINAKFSVRELHRLFSFSSTAPGEPSSTPTTTTMPSLSVPVESAPSASTSTLSFECLDVLMEGDNNTDALFLGIQRMDRRHASPYDLAFHTRHSDNFRTRRRISDVSFEMKLDSLHFDALSFDADDFDVPMEGNADILR